MIWEIPAEPEGVRRVWTPDATGDGHVKWVKSMNRHRGIEMWREAGIASIPGGGGPWHTWGEVLDHGPATDENPDPQPPGVFWSPGLDALYVAQGGSYRLVWFGGELPHPLGTPTPSLPSDAIPINLKQVPGPRVGS